MQQINFKLTGKPVIVILLGAPFDSQNYERTGVPYLKDNFDVIVLDCMPWLSKSLQYNKHGYKLYLKIATAVDFKKTISELKPLFALDFIGVLDYTGAIGTAHFIQKTLRENHTKVVGIKTGTVPAATVNAGRQYKKYLEILLKHPVRFFLKVLGKFLRSKKFNSVIEPDIALLAGEKSLDSQTAKAKIIIWAASSDYYVYKKIDARLVENAKNTDTTKYALFIDDCIALASDYKILKIQPPVDPDLYFQLLRESFDKIEKILGMPVIVAAHPNGKGIDNYKKLFGKRTVYFDRTAELSSKCDLVLTHISTALSYAVLWRKPVILISSKSLDQSFQGLSIRERSQQLQCPLLFMDSDESEYLRILSHWRDFSSGAYKLYVNNYIKSEKTVENLPWQSLRNFIQDEVRTA